MLTWRLCNEGFIDWLIKLHYIKCFFIHIQSTVIGICKRTSNLILSNENNTFLASNILMYAITESPELMNFKVSLSSDSMIMFISLKISNSFMKLLIFPKFFSLLEIVMSFPATKPIDLSFINLKDEIFSSVNYMSTSSSVLKKYWVFEICLNF